MAISFVQVEAQDSYALAAIGQQSNQPGFKARNTRSPVGNIKFTGDPVPASGYQFTVPSGAPVLVGVLVDEEGTVPQGVTVTITQPDGTALQASPYTNANLFVNITNGSITSFAVANPTAGVWTVNVTAPNVTTDFAFLMSTTPASNVQANFQEALPAFLTELVSIGGDASDCWWCQLGAYVTGGILAVIVLTAAAVGTTLLTFATAGAALAPLTAIGITSEVAVNAFFAGLFAANAAGTELTIGLVATYICQALNVCPGTTVQSAPAVASAALA